MSSTISKLLVSMLFSLKFPSMKRGTVVKVIMGAQNVGQALGYLVVQHHKLLQHYEGNISFPLKHSYFFHNPCKYTRLTEISKTGVNDGAFTFSCSNLFSMTTHLQMNQLQLHFSLVQDVLNCLIRYYTLILQCQLFSNLAALRVLLPEPGKGSFCWRTVS